MFFIEFVVFGDCKSDCGVDMSLQSSMYSTQNMFINQSSTTNIHVESNAIDKASHLMAASVFDESNCVRFVLIFLGNTRYPCTKVTVICIANEKKNLAMLNVI